MTESLNIALYLSSVASEMGDYPCIIAPNGVLSYRNLEEQSNDCMRGLHHLGVEKGTRALMMLKPGIEFMILSFGLLKLGAILVFVDPRMGRNNLSYCLSQISSEVFIGSLQAHIARTALNWDRDSLRLPIGVGSVRIPGIINFEEILRLGRTASSVPMSDMPPDEPAAVVFTSGSTGIPKGVVYSHRMFSAQAYLLRDSLKIRPKEVDAITFPLFAFFNPVMRVTSVFPAIDFTRPANANASTLIRDIESSQATHMFGSPALLDRLSRYGTKQKLKLTKMRRILVAGAPVSMKVLERLYVLLEPQAEIYSCYGATEALPLCIIPGRDLLAATRAHPEGGVCLGRVISGVEIAVIRVTDDPIPIWNDSILSKRGEIGELVAAGPNVSTTYWDESSNEMTKIAGPTGTWRHRTGDLGYIDELGRVWMTGRKSQRVITRFGPLFTLQCERIFDQHPRVLRTALVGIGTPPDQRPVLCVELEHKKPGADSKKIRSELLALGRCYSQTRNIDTVLFHHSLPVDARHNAKILREKLSSWAHNKLS